MSTDELRRLVEQLEKRGEEIEKRDQIIREQDAKLKELTEQIKNATAKALGLSEQPEQLGEMYTHSEKHPRDEARQDKKRNACVKLPETKKTKVGKCEMGQGQMGRCDSCHKEVAVYDCCECDTYFCIDCLRRCKACQIPKCAGSNRCLSDDCPKFDKCN